MAVRETVKANKERFGEDAVGELFDGAKRVVVAKGKKVLELDLAATPPGSPDFAKSVLGPSGNLRAPTVRTGNVWLVGFHEEAYGERFG